MKVSGHWCNITCKYIIISCTENPRTTQTIHSLNPAAGQKTAVILPQLGPEAALTWSLLGTETAEPLTHLGKGTDLTLLNTDTSLARDWSLV